MSRITDLSWWLWQSQGQALHNWCHGFKIHTFAECFQVSFSSAAFPAMNSALTTWLEEHGARVSGCEIRECFSKASPSVVSFDSVSSESKVDTIDSREPGDDTSCGCAALASESRARAGDAAIGSEGDKAVGAAATREVEVEVGDARFIAGDCQSASAGFGIFLSRSDADERTYTVDGDRVLISVPLSLLLSAPTALQDPLYGASLRCLHSQGLLDHRMLVLLLLLLHRCHQKQRSCWAP
ncbi:unnamed protein product [Closterium sp. Yama58-4]|nr:unnamed protein product [Closterium sp. Yama58-4]